MWTRKQLFDDGWPVNLAADLQIGCLEHPPDLHVGIKTVFAGKYLQWLFSDLFPILERTNSLLQNRRIFIFTIGVGNKEIVIIIVVIKWVWNKGNESLDNYPVDSFFNGPAAFCDSNTRRFILVSVLYQPQTNCASQIGILNCNSHDPTYSTSFYVSIFLTIEGKVCWAQNTKCFVNVDAFIGETIGNDIELDWIFIDFWVENFLDRSISDQTMEHLKRKIPNIYISHQHQSKTSRNLQISLILHSV